MPQETYARTLGRASQIIGGTDELAARLGVRSEDLCRWLQGTEQVPVDVFLQAVDIVVDADMSELSLADQIRKDSAAPPLS